MKKLTLLFLLTTFSISAQQSVNSYKYIVVPKQFSFVKSVDKYQTSSLTKFLFNKYGFTAFMSDDELPSDLFANRCLALTAEVEDESGMFSTKNKIVLKDCFNKIVFTSKVGSSKEKDYKKAYHEAIRDAFKSVKALSYKYTPVKNQKVSSQAPVAISKHNEKVIPKEETEVNTDATNVLYAQSIKNGYQLVNTKPSVVFQVLKTSNPNVFILNNKKGLLLKKGSVWVAEYYLDNVFTSEMYTIKF